ncbi:FAD-binding oxidoreductase [Hankyongella ginsenosidimutans]|uniref:FAD-binding oxidoreductase n=1 Tax=Hankyongella ginsenosidimutans TaxID=1763828 RepID=UPI001CA324D6|nr:FAD-linked oxidase C-terminal domain-containing protein [Hankyongella ginsenosidimutans]
MEWAAQTAAVNRLVHDIAVDMQGSISAEHGIGLLKREELARTVDPAKAAAMRAIRQALDPNGIFNRGRVFLG